MIRSVRFSSSRATRWIRKPIPRRPIAPVIDIAPRADIVKKTVILPKDTALSVLRNNNTAKSVLAQPSIVIGRQIEMLNVFIGTLDTFMIIIRIRASEQVRDQRRKRNRRWIHRRRRIISKRNYTSTINENTSSVPRNSPGFCWSANFENQTTCEMVIE